LISSSKREKKHIDIKTYSTFIFSFYNILTPQLFFIINLLYISIMIVKFQFILKRLNINIVIKS